ncbi:ATP-dependent helicase HrpB [Vitreimonas flagellata]|uniref:ATP-dependent helicase HrpB n=1 Tax=Vitreimonas flagellata TaxID=2560861 RepID=UPI001075746E|nr:ATP-dependent helicase HrpB [Vitreimonas flagellata]
MLPVEEVLPDLCAALAARSEAVLVAPPGAGKTTRVPPALLGEPWAQAGKIILLSPRRIAARAAAARMAFELGERVGETTGYRVRLDSRIGPKTRIEVVTAGVFSRMILDDPELNGVAAVLFDEFHERSLEGDLGLALARDAQSALRPDLKIVVMSATLDAARIAALLNDAPVIVSEGRMFPVTHVYWPRDPRGRLEEETAAAVRAALSAERGSALVFLPGVREIERTAETLRASVSDPSVDIRPLYGAMSPADQDAAISPAPQGRRKVVLATSIAETSLTIDGVRIVVDAGLARRPRFEPALGLSRLETVRASQAAITQRAGRAGRLEPGVCWRLWSEGETRALPEFDRPEMLDADLSGLALDLAAWGVSDPTTLAWLDPPPKPAWAEAIALLKRIGALDESGRLTEHGGVVARLPLPPRLAHMVIVAARNGEALLAARIAILLTEQGLGGRSADLRERLHRFGTERGQRADAARSLADRIARNAGGVRNDVEEERAGVLLALAYPDRVAKSRGSAFTMVNGRAAAIEPASPLAREPFLVIADISGAAGRAQILLGAPIALADIETMFADEIETGASATVDPATGAVRGRRTRRLGRVVLSEAPLERLSGEDLQQALLGAVREDGLSLLDWDDAALQMRARVAFMHGLDAEIWPDWSDETLVASLEDWLAPALMNRSRLKDVNVAEALANALPYDLRRKLDAEAPARLETPAGSSLRIDYAGDGGPALEVRLQELFGQDKHPSVANGRVPLSLRLLSPAHRPVQTTKDLPGFWRGSYAAVRSEMRGRYPKHPWPEDPLTAPPTRRAKPRGS